MYGPRGRAMGINGHQVTYKSQSYRVLFIKITFQIACLEGDPLPVVSFKINEQANKTVILSINKINSTSDNSIQDDWINP